MVHQMQETERRDNVEEVKECGGGVNESIVPRLHRHGQSMLGEVVNDQVRKLRKM